MNESKTIRLNLEASTADFIKHALRSFIKLAPEKRRRLTEIRVTSVMLDRLAIDHDEDGAFFESVPIAISDTGFDGTVEIEFALEQSYQLSISRAKAYVRLAEQARDQREQKDLAFKILARGLRQIPDSAVIWDCVADTHRMLGTGAVEAQESYAAFQRAGIEPYEYYCDVAWASYGFLLEANDFIIDAGAAYRWAMEIDPNYRFPIGRLSRLLRLHTSRYSEAEALALRCIEIDPEDARSWFDLGALYDQKLKRYSEAEAAYRRCLQLDPTHLAAWHDLANVLAFDLNQPSKAEEAYLKALELPQEDSWTWRAYGEFLREFTDRFSEAETAFLRALAIDADNWEACLELGILYHEKLRQTPKARHFYSEAKRLGAPGDDIDYRIAVLSQVGPMLRTID